MNEIVALRVHTPWVLKDPGGGCERNIFGRVIETVAAGETPIRIERASYGASGAGAPVGIPGRLLQHDRWSDHRDALGGDAQCPAHIRDILERDGQTQYRLPNVLYEEVSRKSPGVRARRRP